MASYYGVAPLRRRVHEIDEEAVIFVFSFPPRDELFSLLAPWNLAIAALHCEDEDRGLWGVREGSCHRRQDLFSRRFVSS